MIIVIAPFSNDHIRDWPLLNFRALVGLCVAETDSRIFLVGSASQRTAINVIVAPYSAQRVSNLAGRSPWRETGDLIHRADIVVANNSGIAHFSAKLGKATLCLFSASHSPFEWRPLGPGVTTLFTPTGCSPCASSGIKLCPYGKACLEAISPRLAFEWLVRAKGSIQQRDLTDTMAPMP